MNKSKHLEVAQNRSTPVGFDAKGRFWLPPELNNGHLTRSEIRVLRGILDGKTAKQIAKVLEVSPRTVEEHTAKMRRKLRCHSKHDIHLVLIKYGIADLLLQE